MTTESITTIQIRPFFPSYAVQQSFVRTHTRRSHFLLGFRPGVHKMRSVECCRRVCSGGSTTAASGNQRDIIFIVCVIIKRLTSFINNNIVTMAMVCVCVCVCAVPVVVGIGR